MTNIQTFDWNRTKLTFTAIFTFLFIVFLAPSLSAQNQDMRYAIGEDGVYIYHTERLDIGDGFNIYRSDPGSDEFIKLNEEPLRGTIYPSELPSVLGDIYEPVRLALEAEDATEVYFSLRSNTLLGRLYTFVHPEIAQALGRLFVDTSVNVGDRVEYRVEIVNDLGEATGKVIEEEFEIEPVNAPSPENFTVENDGYEITLKWDYPSMNSVDDKIIRFETYYTDQGETLINDELILRDNNRNEYIYRFTVDELGREYNFHVSAMDITGQEAARSETITYFIEDNIAPGLVDNVQLVERPQGLELSWPVSPETDLAGYAIYRSVNSDDDFERINDDLHDPINTVFIDSLVQEGNTYYYKISAVDNSGNEGKRSANAMRYISDNTPPLAPAMLSAVVADDNSTVRLSWGEYERPVDFRRFIVLRRKISGSTNVSYSQISEDELISTLHVDRGVGGARFEEGVFYEYGVVVADSARNFSDTTFTTLQIPDITPPNAPVNVIADNIGGVRVDLTWSPSPSGDVVQYNVYRKSGEAESVLLNSTEKNRRIIRDENVQTGIEYIYAVSATDSLGNEGVVMESSTVRVRNYDPPRKVRNVQIYSSENGVDITWEEVPASDLVGYIVYSSRISAGQFEALNEEPIQSTSFNHSGGNETFWYRVRAVDSSGNLSDMSEPVKLNTETN
jgi:fibronectin type 3 domain-containing protein